MLADVRGYVGLVRQVVFVARLQQAWSADALPPFEQLLLGGTASLRGFRLGYRMGDRLVAGSAECGCRLPHPFGSRASASHCLPTRARYGADERLADTRWDRSVGAGFFINAPVVSMRLDVAHGLDASRVHTRARPCILRHAGWLRHPSGRPPPPHRSTARSAYRPPPTARLPPPTALPPTA